MKLILNLLLLFVGFVLARRALGRFFSPEPKSPPPRSGRSEPPPQEPSSGAHPAFRDDEVIEDGEFEELD